MKKYSKNEVKEKGKNRHGIIHDLDCLLTKISVSNGLLFLRQIVKKAEEPLKLRY